YWKVCVRDEPRDIDILVSAGETAMETGNVALANEWFRRAAGLTSDNAVVHSNLGLIQMGSGAFAEGITSLQKAVKTAPHDSKHHSNLAMAFIVTGRHGDAADSFRQVVRLQSQDANAKRDLAWLLSTTPLADHQSNVSEAMKLAKDACQLTGGNRSETF